jgi:2-hydroxychromene-2-carboxylate isomerase
MFLPGGPPERLSAWAQEIEAAGFDSLWQGELVNSALLPLAASVSVTAGVPADLLLARTEEPDVKARLRLNTEAAVRRGVLGTPTVFVGEAMVWGNDRLTVVAALTRSKTMGKRGRSERHFLPSPL